MGRAGVCSGVSLASIARRMTDETDGFMMEQSGSMKPTTILLSLWEPPGGGRVAEGRAEVSTRDYNE
jgi:hypothetical protein